MRNKKEDYISELKKSYERWKVLYHKGGSDPSWEDGVNLNLVRNHIIYYKGKIEETMYPDEYPGIYFSPLPPVVDNKYMARKEEILTNALKSYNLYECNEDLQYIRAVKDSNLLNEKAKKKISIDNIVGYADGLKYAIENKNYVNMRRHENPDNYIRSFRQCREDIEKLLSNMLYNTDNSYEDEIDAEAEDEELLY